MKTCSILCVTGWSAALAFGWLALAAPQGEPAGQLALHMALAGTGAAAGMWSWLRISRRLDR
ncbi:hypothetical protein [Frigidibacter oleivorans]|uniref:hypothetical protein n=1 Tax=Frigidibacter oleivorans TaxID=2487129 RepID=UPI000F8CAA77|nr:hypothetical protein [Frigidibacter oleivorans]